MRGDRERGNLVPAGDISAVPIPAFRLLREESFNTAGEEHNLLILIVIMWGELLFLFVWLFPFHVHSIASLENPL